MNYPYLYAMRDKVAAMMYNAAVEQMNLENDILASYYGSYNPYLDKVAISQNMLTRAATNSLRSGKSIDNVLAQLGRISRNRSMAVRRAPKLYPSMMTYYNRTKNNPQAGILINQIKSLAGPESRLLRNTNPGLEDAVYTAMNTLSR